MRLSEEDVILWLAGGMTPDEMRGVNASSWREYRIIVTRVQYYNATIIVGVVVVLWEGFCVDEDERLGVGILIVGYQKDCG